MRIVIEKSGYAIPHSVLIDATLRYDLIPVPLTLEFQILINKDTQDTKEGDTIIILDDEVPLTIIKKERIDSDIVQDGHFLSIAKYTAVLSGCENLLEPSSKAILLQNTSFAEAYRACGVKIPFQNDIPLLDFHCFYGKTPSYEMALRSCEEAAVILFKNKKLNAERINNLKKNNPLLNLNSKAIVWESNPQVEKNAVQNFITVNQDGATIEESLKGNQSANFYPNMDSRRLKNLRTVLIRKGSAMRQLSLEIMAGDIITVDNEKNPYIIMTSAHRFSTGTLGKQSVMASRFWLAQVNES